MKFNYRLIRSGRKTVSITVNSENEITVRAPKLTTESEIEKIIISKSSWINKVIQKNLDNKNGGAEISSYKKILIGGKVKPLFVGEKDLFCSDKIYLKDVTRCKKVLVGGCAESFINVFNCVSQTTGLKAVSVNFKDYKSRWGCCSGDNRIIFNYRIFMLPEKLQLYLILHELCHTRYHDHSKNFWRLMHKFMPDCKSVRAQLKNYTYLINLYRCSIN